VSSWHSRCSFGNDLNIILFGLFYFLQEGWS
jgi:hypothetical protein